MSLSTMNWKRGLLRLWAVAAVLWVGVAFYSNDTVQRVQDAYAWENNPYAKYANMNEIYDALRTANANGDKASVAKLSDYINSQPAMFRGGPSAAAPLKPSIWPPLFDFAKLAFIPPLLLLALGCCGLRVGRGFRR